MQFKSPFYDKEYTQMSDEPTKKHDKNKKPARTANRQRIAKGSSGNVDGRPPDRMYWKRKAQELTPAVLESVKDILLDPKAPQRDRLQAAQLIWNWGWGKPGIAKDEQSDTEHALSNLPQVVIASVKTEDVDDDDNN